MLTRAQQCAHHKRRNKMKEVYKTSSISGNLVEFFYTRQIAIRCAEEFANHGHKDATVHLLGVDDPLLIYTGAQK